ncbi:hypothetical protein [Nocardiopsis chromatogenes]|nr:hypothetical protein [Nocardiopsis chromatogenes]
MPSAPPGGLWAGVCRKVCALYAAIRRDRLTGAPVKGALVAHHH